MRLENILDEASLVEVGRCPTPRKGAHPLDPRIEDRARGTAQAFRSVSRLKHTRPTKNRPLRKTRISGTTARR